MILMMMRAIMKARTNRMTEKAMLIMSIGDAGHFWFKDLTEKEAAFSFFLGPAAQMSVHASPSCDLCLRWRWYRQPILFYKPGG